MLQRTNNTPLEKEEIPSQNWEGIFNPDTLDSLIKEKMKLLWILSQTNEIIPFETFIFSSNNFSLYFQNWMVSGFLTNTPFFQAFKEKNPLLYNDVCALFDWLNETQKSYLHILSESEENIKKLKSDSFMFHFLELFYEAYLELKKLWVSNGDLLWFNA